MADWNTQGSWQTQGNWSTQGNQQTPSWDRNSPTHDTFRIRDQNAERAAAERDKELKPIVDAVLARIGFASSTINISGRNGQFTAELRQELIEQIAKQVLNNSTITATSNTVCNGDGSTTTTTTVTISA